MPVCRVEKTSNYTVMSNHHLRNKQLTLRSKGLLSLMLSLPDDWDYTLEGLVTLSKEGYDCIKMGVKELEAAGYIVRHQTRDERGKMSNMEYIIYEHPVSPLQPSTGKPSTENPRTGNPRTEKPSTGKPSTENPRQLNTNLQSTKGQNTEKQNCNNGSWGQGEQTTHPIPAFSTPHIDTHADNPPLAPSSPRSPFELDPDEARAQQDKFDDLEHTLRQCGFTPTERIMLDLKDLMLAHGLERVKKAIEIAGGGESTRHIRYVKGILNKEAERSKASHQQIIVKPGENPFAAYLEE